MAETALSRWLRYEMPRRGYPLDGPRAGGLSRLADDAKISRSSLSRIVSGEAEPSMDTLRALGRVFGLSLGAMMVHAGVAQPEDVGLGTQSDSGEEQPPHLSPVPNIQLGRPNDPDPRDVVPGGLRNRHEVQLWTIAELPYQLRAEFIRLLREREEQVRGAGRPPAPRRNGATG